MLDRKKLLIESESWLTKDGRVIPLKDMEDSHFKRVTAIVRSRAVLQITNEGLAMLRGPRPNDFSPAYDDWEFELIRSTDREWTDLPWSAPIAREILRRASA